MDASAAPAIATAAPDTSLRTYPPDPPNIAGETPQMARPLTRVFCDIPEGLGVTGAEVEICEAYLAQLIGGIISNDNEP
ncbi:MAG TPA: hypothetical protein VMU87_16110 [Stellaceae bacterium]|nr:hypothetical protein [Stellaceae bacterium]